jgi:hypothetical protein
MTFESLGLASQVSVGAGAALMSSPGSGAINLSFVIDLCAAGAND